MSALDTLAAKSARLDRCLRRIEDTYAGGRRDLERDLDAQDVVILNLQRACEQVIDVGRLTCKALGIPRPASYKQIFVELERAGAIDRDLATRLSGMVGFRNVIVHEYEEIDFGIVRAVIEGELGTLRRFVGRAAVLVGEKR